MKSFNRILLIGLAATVISLLFFLYRVLATEGNWIAQLISIGLLVQILISLGVLYLVNKKTERINLFLVIFSLLIVAFTIVLLITPKYIIDVWNYLIFSMVCFIGYGILIYLKLNFRRLSGWIVMLSTLSLGSIYLVQSNNSVLYTITFMLLCVSSLLCLILLFRNKNQST